MSTREGSKSRPESLDGYVATGSLQPETPALQSFVIDARSHSGLDPAGLDPSTATYTLLLPGDTLEGLDLDHPVTLDGETLPLGLILAPQLRYDHASLARALWAVDSFPDLQGFLGALRVLLRFSRAEPGAPLTACVLPVAETQQRIARVEQGETTGSGGELLIDSITRSLGLRRKLLLLDYQQRQRDSSRAHGPLGRTRRS